MFDTQRKRVQLLSSCTTYRGWNTGSIWRIERYLQQSAQYGSELYANHLVACDKTFDFLQARYLELLVKFLALCNAVLDLKPVDVGLPTILVTGRYWYKFIHTLALKPIENR